MRVGIKDKFTLTLVLMNFLAIIFSFSISMYIVYKSIQKNLGSTATKNLKNMEKKLENLNVELKTEARILSKNIQVISILDSNKYIDINSEKTGEKTYYRTYDIDKKKYYRYKFISEISEMFQNYSIGNEKIEIDIISINGKSILNRDKKISKENLKKYLSKFIGNSSADYSFYEIESGKMYSKTLSPIYSKKDKNKFIGFVLLKLPIEEKMLKEILSEEQDEVMVIDNNYKIISTTIDLEKTDKIDLKNSKKITIDRSIYLLKKIELKGFLWEKSGEIIVAAKENYIWEISKEISLHLFLELFLIFVMIFVVFNYMLDMFLDSIRELTLKINLLRGGKFNIDLTKLKNRKDEIGLLAHDFDEMADVLKIKTEKLEEIKEENEQNSSELKAKNEILAKMKYDFEKINSNRDKSNKILNSRISEVTNLYYLIIKMTDNITNEKFYSIIVRGIREGLFIKNVIYYEKEENILIPKAKTGTNKNLNEIKITKELEYKMLKNSIIEVTECKSSLDINFKNPYILVLKTKEDGKNEIFGVIIFDNNKKMDEYLEQTLNTYSKTIILALENRKLYKKMVEQLKRTEKVAEKLKNADMTKNTILSNMSHELKAPLVPIMGYVEMFLNSELGDITVNQRKALFTVLNNVERLQEMIENILNYSKLENGEYDFYNKEFNIKELVYNVSSTFENRVIRKNININIEMNLKDYLVDGDKDVLGQVLKNIISNAVKFSYEGKEIKLIVTEKDDKIKLTVKDSGVGIEIEKIKNIYDDFRQLEEGYTRKHNGVGLGLTVVKKILEKYDEKLYIKSFKGIGTEVSFYIKKLKKID
ncbi:sensor histidine kinase [Haliovirga abyssi]|uniref:histidine kinase n=1 Tax=Haliovirga abyssi TaxID=2996794 RepID=A0AAU9DS33_9FUSO|nr:ATP-binding protein [Haliovirga abyssi]BDU49794.1 hypothetical protein HLVA_03630 [Haliovirga abyssi]